MIESYDLYLILHNKHNNRSIDVTPKLERTSISIYSSVFHDRANSRYKGSKNCAIEHRKGHQMFYRTTCCIIFKGLLCIVQKPRNEISSKEWSLEQFYPIKLNSSRAFCRASLEGDLGGNEQVKSSKSRNKLHSNGLPLLGYF